MRPVAPAMPKPVSVSAMVAPARSIVPDVATAAREPERVRFTRALPASRSSRLDSSASSDSGAVPVAFTESPGPENGTCPLRSSARPEIAAPVILPVTLVALPVALPRAESERPGSPAVLVEVVLRPDQSSVHAIAGAAVVPVIVARPEIVPSAPSVGAKPLTTAADTRCAVTVRLSAGEMVPSTRTLPPPSARLAPAMPARVPPRLMVTGCAERDRQSEGRTAERVEADHLSARRAVQAAAPREVEVRSLGAGVETRRPLGNGRGRLRRIEPGPADGHGASGGVAADERRAERIVDVDLAFDRSGGDRLVDEVVAGEGDGHRLPSVRPARIEAGLRRCRWR